MAVCPQKRDISSSNPMPRLSRFSSRVARMSFLDLIRTSSPGWRSSLPVGVRPTTPPLRKRQRSPSRNHSRRGSTFLLTFCMRLNRPTAERPQNS